VAIARLPCPSPVCGENLGRQCVRTACVGDHVPRAIGIWLMETGSQCAYTLKGQFRRDPPESRMDQKKCGRDRSRPHLRLSNSAVNSLEGSIHYGTNVAGVGTENGVATPFAWLCEEPPAPNALKKADGATAPAGEPGKEMKRPVLIPIPLKF